LKIFRESGRWFRGEIVFHVARKTCGSFSRMRAARGYNRAVWIHAVLEVVDTVV